VLWHDRGVPANPPADDAARSARARRAARRRDSADERRQPPYDEAWGAAGFDDARGYGDDARGYGDDAGPAGDTPDAGPARVRRLLSAAIGGFALLLTVGLVFGAVTTRISYAVVVFGVQALFVFVWTVAARPPAPRVVAGVGLAAAVAADVAAVLVRPASLAPLAYVTAAAFVVGVIGQLSRPAGRVRVTESLASTLTVSVGVVAFAMLVVLTKHPRGTQSIVACFVAAGLALAVARLTDTVAALPRVAPQVPRGGLGVVLGAMAGTGAAALAGAYLDGLEVQPTALAGLLTAMVALMVDLSVAYSEAGRPAIVEDSAVGAARHMQGPLGGFALAAPVVYVASVLLVMS
jgi:hypothetical protein